MADAALSFGDSATTTAVAHKSQKRKSPYRWAVLALLIVLLVGTLFPFFLTLINAVKTGVDYATGGPVSLPTTIDFSALKKFWDLADFSRKPCSLRTLPTIRRSSASRSRRPKPLA